MSTTYSRAPEDPPHSSSGRLHGNANIGKWLELAPNAALATKNDTDP